MKTWVLSAMVVLLMGCAAAPGTSGGYKSAADRLRDSSMDVVRAYAAHGGTYVTANGEQKMIEASQEAARNQLKDPGSAQFRNVRVESFEGGKVVCGQINGKNSYGGYVGFKQFVASPISATFESTGSRYPQADVLANTGLYSACGAR
jgi:hypothetical protein